MRRRYARLALAVVAVVLLGSGIGQAAVVSARCTDSQFLVVGSAGPSCHVSVTCPTSVDVDGLPIPVAGCDYVAQVTVSGVGIVGGTVTVSVTFPSGASATNSCGAAGVVTCQASATSFSPGGETATANCSWTNGIAVLVRLRCTLTGQVFTGPG